MREPLSSTQVEQYLSHIGVTLTDGKPCLADLHAILKGHLCTIPYENLVTVRDNSFVAELGIEPTLPLLDNDAMVDTLVHRKRGGYCWQTNGVLAAALMALGYDLYEGPARVVEYVNCWTSTYDEAAQAKQAVHDRVAFKGVGHMVLLVKGPEDGHRWMLDTGFGGHSPPHPIRLQAPFSDTSNGEVFRVRQGLIGRARLPTADDLREQPQALGWYVQRRSKSRGWQDQFFFMESQMLPGDCENLNFYCANAPTSLFYHTLVMAIQTHEGGRITLFGDELRTHSPDGSVEQKKIETLEDFKQMLTLFGIPVDEL